MLDIVGSAGNATVAQKLGRYSASLDGATLPADVTEIAKHALLDFLACAVEARSLPWARQATAVARTSCGPAPIVGTPYRVGPLEAAFANATAGHGLIREDMHPGSCSHLGVVVWPTLLALLGQKPVRGVDMFAAAAAGYNVGARIGVTLFDAALAGRFRPTGVTGVIGAAAAGGRMLGLDADRVAAAIGQAANCVAGLNNWPWAGSTEVFFHAGNGARNAVTAALLARAGAYVSPGALDGQGGLYDAYRRPELARGLADGIDAFHALREIYFKPAPACNFVQTPCQAALALVQAGVIAGDVAAINVATFPAAAQYPGCDHAGPFVQLVQAKMSIQFSVAATLVQGALCEAAFARLDDAELLRLVEATTLTFDPEFTAAYPSKQGAAVTVTLRDGSRRTHRLQDVRPCEPPEILARFRGVADAAFRPVQAAALEEFVMNLDTTRDASALIPLLAAQHD